MVGLENGVELAGNLTRIPGLLTIKGELFLTLRFF